MALSEAQRRDTRNLDFVIERLEEACSSGWYYGYVGSDGFGHNSFQDALHHLRQYRSGRAALGEKDSE